MGHLLNFYRNASYDAIKEYTNSVYTNLIKNQSTELISIFDVDEYIPILEFESEISSASLRKQARHLFDELAILPEKERKQRIAEYNKKVKKYIKGKGIIKKGLDLSLSGIGLLNLPASIISRVLQILGMSKKTAPDKIPGINAIAEAIREKIQSLRSENKNIISYLSRINRVARLREPFNKN